MTRLEDTLAFCVFQRDNIARTLSLLDLAEKDSTRTMLEARMDAYSYVVSLILLHLNGGMDRSEVKRGTLTDLRNEYTRVGNLYSVEPDAILMNMSAYEYFSSMESIYLDIIDELEDGTGG